jgi:hypothetical protein
MKRGLFQQKMCRVYLDYRKFLVRCVYCTAVRGEFKFPRRGKSSLSNYSEDNWKVVLRIRAIFVRIRIRGFIPLTKGSGPCNFRQ